MSRFLMLISTLILMNACSIKPKGSFSIVEIPVAPDYSNSESWAALPTKKDSADRTPHPSLIDLQATALVDVFFLHPTTFTGDKGQNKWNGPVNDEKLNEKTDKGAILNQASIFNGVGRVYAPRYRQAHLNAYFHKDTSAVKQALELAYQDVRKAFLFYLEHYNNGRPIIIAGHSQGTSHAKSLIRELFDGKPLQKKLVAAYLVGMPVPEDYFENIKICESPEETNCFCSWRSWQKGHYPKKFTSNNNIAVTNPLSWMTNEEYVDKKFNEGSVLRKFEKSFYTQLADAQVHDGLLWLTKPRFPGSFFIWFKNYHVADFNLYYFNVRKNAQQRAKAFLGNTSSE